jgi:hypothetical protein
MDGGAPTHLQLAERAVERSAVPRELLEQGEEPLVVVRALADAKRCLQELGERLVLDHCRVRLDETADGAGAADDIRRVLAAAVHRR